ncbi:WD repeat-containing protein 92, putative (WDR92) [Plasmodium ovale curtisi]|uniref:WD repeat-containing protein 92, putative (WDR92) n=1 Tax=Plasmodium ovale curtisi TaxID=864141 RepID=A0A1A8WT22_PLAOA|nr:WD repeat-containing protein 92, putative (WDR92) [Plasmodium ovale curtisi]
MFYAYVLKAVNEDSGKESNEAPSHHANQIAKRISGATTNSCVPSFSSKGRKLYQNDKHHFESFLYFHYFTSYPPSVPMNIQNSPQIIEHINYPLDNTIYDVKWVDGKSDIIAGETERERERERERKREREKNKGSFDGRILLYDINNMSKEYYTIKKHTKLINKIDCKSHKNNNLIVSGSRDGSVKIFDIRTNREVVSLQPPKGSTYTPDCWCVATGNNHIEENPLCGERQENMNICAGYDNGDIKFFDIKTMTLEYEVNAKKHNSTRLVQQNEIVHLLPMYLNEFCHPFFCRISFYRTFFYLLLPHLLLPHLLLPHLLLPHLLLPHLLLPHLLFTLLSLPIPYKVNVNNGVCSISYDRKDTQKNKLICSTLEGNIYIFNLDVYSEETGYAYSKDQIISGAYISQKNRDIFAALGGDGNVKMSDSSEKMGEASKEAKRKPKNDFANTIMCERNLRGIVGELNKLNHLNVSTQPIISFDWHRDKLGLCVFASLDQTLRVYIITKLNLC